MARENKKKTFLCVNNLQLSWKRWRAQQWAKLENKLSVANWIIFGSRKSFGWLDNWQYAMLCNLIQRIEPWTDRKKSQKCTSRIESRGQWNRKCTHNLRSMQNTHSIWLQSVHSDGLRKRSKNYFTGLLFAQRHQIVMTTVCDLDPIGDEWFSNSKFDAISSLLDVKFIFSLV